MKNLMQLKDLIKNLAKEKNINSQVMNFSCNKKTHSRERSRIKKEKIIEYKNLYDSCTL
jgi:hypothetical protein